MQARPFVIAGILVVAFFAMRLVRDRPWRKVDRRGMEVPALEMEDADTLALAAVTEKQPGQRRIRLTAGAGEATLTLGDPRALDQAIGMGFGKAVLEPSADRAKGAAFVAEVARWLHRPVPPPGTAGELGPVPLGYARLGEHDGWEANKLFFERGKRSAEVFLNLSADGRQARLLEKDEDYRDDLVALLALLLRDGLPPRRSPRNDPLVASMEPLWKDFQPMAGAGKLRSLVPFAGGFLAAREIGTPDRRRSEVLVWAHPRETPRRLAEIDGVVTGLGPAPGGKVCGVSLVHPKGKMGVGSNDPGMRAVMDLATGALSKIEESDGFYLSFAGVFSPDGKRLALSSGQGTAVYDVTSRKLLARTPAGFEGTPVAWDAGGLLLSNTRYDVKSDDGEGQTSYHRWQPASPPRPAEPPPLDAPDGRHHLAITKDGLAISGPGGRRLVPARGDDLEAFRSLTPGEARWLGPEQVLVPLEEPMALDLASGKLRYLVAGPELRIDVASADGRLVIARDDRDRYFWASR